MPYASDKLWDGFIRRNRGRITNEVKARDMLLHLPCLTTTDSEEVEAAYTRHGNTYAMSQLLDNLRRRENWPEEFIGALQVCEYRALAQEIRDVYKALKQPRNQKQKPAAPSGRSASSRPALVHPPSPVLNTPAYPAVSSHPPMLNTPAYPAVTSLSPVLDTPAHPAVSSHPPMLNTPSYPAVSSYSPVLDTSAHPAVTSHSPVLDTSAHPAISSLPPLQAAQSAPLLPSSPSMSVLPPSESRQPQLCHEVPPEAFINPNTTNQPTFPSSMTAGLAPAPSIVQVPPANTLAAPVSMTNQSDRSQASHFGVSTEFATLGARATSVPLADISKAQSVTQSPYTCSQQTSQSTRIPIQETNSPSCKTNPLHQKPEENSDPTFYQVRTYQHPSASSESPAIHLSGTQTITSPTTVSTYVNARTYRTPPTMVNIDAEEEYFSKPGVLQSVNEEQVTVIQASEPCSLTSGDLEISRPAGDLASEARAQLSPRGNTHDCPEQVLHHSETCSVTNDLDLSIVRNSPQGFPQLNGANHSRGSVDDHNRGSPNNQRLGLVDDPSHPVPVEDHFESVPDEGTRAHEIHFSQEPSIQNYDRNLVSGQEKSVMMNCRNTKTEDNTERSESKSQEVREHQEKGAKHKDNQKEISRAGVREALHSVPLFPAAVVVIGVCALVFALRLRK